jgi:photosystem II stability/assembly factor-like uncharacterized protein
VAPPEGNRKSTVQSLDFTSVDHGWRIVGGAVQETRDGGRTWLEVPFDHDAVETRLASETRIWIIAGYAPSSVNRLRLMASEDGGKRWTRYDLGEVLPARVLFAEERSIVLESTEHSLFASSDGGQTWTQVR